MNQEAFSQFILAFCSDYASKKSKAIEVLFQFIVEHILQEN